MAGLFDLQGKVVVATGGMSGIGLGFLQCWVADGGPLVKNF